MQEFRFNPDKYTRKNHKRLYGIWHGMLNRTEESHNPAYKYYKDISVCYDWHSFREFRNWALANGYADNLTIERIDNEGNYEPGNCKWATMKEQAQNRRNSKKETINGVTKTMSEWCRIYGVDYQRIYQRVRKGWSIQQAIAFDKPTLFEKTK